MIDNKLVRFTALTSSVFALAACSSDASLGDNQDGLDSTTETTATDNGAIESGDDASGASTDSTAHDSTAVETTTEDDSVDDNANVGSSEDSSASPDPATDAAPTSDDSNQPSGTSDDVTMTDAPDTTDDPPAMDPSAPSSDGGTDDTALVDAGATPEADPCAADECSAGCPESCSTDASTPDPALAYTEVLGNRYDAEQGCFELVREVAGTIAHDPDDPVGCLTILTMGISPDGECWLFNDSCQPDGFVPGPADHECGVGDPVACPEM